MKISIIEAIRLLLNGQVIALPTETVYGLAACAHNPLAIQKVYDLKARPPQNPLIIHLNDASQIEDYVDGHVDHLKNLTQNFWPGPLTLVVPVKTHLIPSIARAGLNTSAFRVPLLELSREVIQQTGPLVAPSANKSGRPSATKPEHVEIDFGSEFPVLENPTNPLGLESTILVYKNDLWLVGRLGALPISKFEPILGYIPELALTTKTPLCPGQLFRHYAPDAKITLGTNGWSEALQEEFDFVVGFRERSYPGAQNVIHWGSESSVEQCAQDLYSTLRLLDTLKITHVFWDAQFNSNEGWEAIVERLTKASLA